MYRLIPPDEIEAEMDAARREMDEFFGDYKDLLWIHTEYCDNSRRYEILH